MVPSRTLLQVGFVIAHQRAEDSCMMGLTASVRRLGLGHQPAERSYQLMKNGDDDSNARKVPLLDAIAEQASDTRQLLPIVRTLYGRRWIMKIGIAVVLLSLTGGAFLCPAQDVDDGPDSSPLLEIRRIGDQLELEVPPKPEAGVVFVMEGQSLEQLLEAPSLRLLTNAPVENSLKLPLTPEQMAFFYAIRRAGGSLEDYFKPDIEEVVEESPPFALWTLGFPSPLLSGVTYNADFILVGPTNELTDFTGIAQLSLVNKRDGSVHPDATIDPPEIQFVDGICRADVRIVSSTPLDGYWIVVNLEISNPNTISQSARPLPTLQSSTRLVLRPIIGLPATAVAVDQVYVYAKAEVEARVDELRWSNPLPNDKPEVSGTFGEWRGHVRRGSPNANVHYGLDLVADGGISVKAARGGIVVTNGVDGTGRFIVINHLDGWYSRYLHLATTNTGPEPGDYIVRDRKTPIGFVGASSSPHLHFELRKGDWNETSMYSGRGVDPIRQENMFAVRIPPSQITVSKVSMTTESPTSTYDRFQTGPLDDEEGHTFVVIQLVHNEPPVDKDKKLRRLSPRLVAFKPEGTSETTTIDLSTMNAISAYLPDEHPPHGGFALYTEKHGAAEKTESPDYEPHKLYRYWFRWDTSGYNGQPAGPRTFTVTAANYAGTTTVHTLKWGPEILSITQVPEPPMDLGQKFRIRVRAWRGEDVNTGPEQANLGSWAFPTDWLRLDLPEGGVWLANNSQSLEGVPLSLVDFRVPDIQEYDFHWKPTLGSPVNPKVKVTSRTVPAIAHEEPLLAIELIRGVQVSASSQLYWVRNGTVTLDRRARYLTDGSGLHNPTDGSAVFHMAGEGFSWESAGNKFGSTLSPSAGVDDPEPMLTFSLPARYSVASLSIWNFGETGRGVKRFKLFSLDGPGQLVLEGQVPYNDWDTPERTFVIDPPVVASGFRMQIVENWDGITFPTAQTGFSTLVGLGEVQFFGTPAP